MICPLLFNNSRALPSLDQRPTRLLLDYRALKLPVRRDVAAIASEHWPSSHLDGHPSIRVGTSRRELLATHHPYFCCQRMIQPAVVPYLDLRSSRTPSMVPSCTWVTHVSWSHLMHLDSDRRLGDGAKGWWRCVWTGTN